MNLIDSSSTRFSLRSLLPEAAPALFQSTVAALSGPPSWLLWGAPCHRSSGYPSLPPMAADLFQDPNPLLLFSCFGGIHFPGDSLGKRVLHLYIIGNITFTLDLLFGLDKLPT